MDTNFCRKTKLAINEIEIISRLMNQQVEHTHFPISELLETFKKKIKTKSSKKKFAQKTHKFFWNEKMC